MTYRVGVTGGIGSGKSLVCRLFMALGIPIYDADSRARLLMEEDPGLVKGITQLFGDNVYRDGRLERKLLAGIVFNDKKKLAQLNALVHPAVKKDAEQWFLQQKSIYAIKEAALIYEVGGESQLDAVIVVTAPLKLRLKRVHQRDGSSYRDIRARMDKQVPEKLKAAKADFIIRNNEKRSLIRQVTMIHLEILRRIENQKEKKS